MKPINRTLTLAALIALTSLGASCSSVRYGDPDKVERVNVDYGRTDQQTFAQNMTKSLLDSPQLAFLDGPGKTDDKRLIAFMGGVRNETHEHVSTEGITDSIRTALLQSGRFRFVAGRPGQDELGDQVRFQQDSGRVDPTMAKEFGRQLGADVVLYGTLRSIQKRKGRSLESGGVRTEDVYYQFVFNCVNIETGEIIWSNEEELTKAARIGLFGSS